MAQAATVRFYFDADVLGLAHVVCSLRPDSTFPGDLGATIKRRIRPVDSVPDRRNWVIISRDSHHRIATNRDRGRPRPRRATDRAVRT